MRTIRTCFIIALLVTTVGRADRVAAEVRAPAATPGARAVPAGFQAADDDHLRPALGGAPTVPGPRDGMGATGAFDLLEPAEREFARRALAQSPFTKSAPAKPGPTKSTLAEIGGDEILVRDSDEIDIVEVQIAEDGTIFVAVGNSVSGGTWAEYITVYRSLDGGTTFTLWSEFGSPAADVRRLRDLDVTSGTNARIFVTYMRYGTSGFDVDVAFADPAAETPVWTTTTPLTGTVSYLNPDLETDHRSFDAYYIYLVSSGIDGDGDDIWYTRSTTLGSTWEAPYRIGTLTTSGNLMYAWPRVSYGFGGVVHVLWTYTERLQSTFDDGARYRSATGYGGAAANWGGIYPITSTADGVDQVSLDICASLVDNNVALVHTTGPVNQYNPAYRTSTDAGVNWSAAPGIPMPWNRGADLEYSFTGNQFVATGIIGDVDGMEQVLSRAPAVATTGWSTPERFSDGPYDYLWWPSLALDPSRGEQAAVAVTEGYSTPVVEFDAEWRGDPGYPNFEPGMPRALESAPSSSPALVDLDGDGNLEIVYGTEDGLIEVRHHDGERAAGWPVVLPSLSNSPIAVGELAGGQLSIVAGTEDGRVYAFDTNGQLQAGWPYDAGTGAPAYVSIGALGGPYPRTVVAGSGGKLTFLNYRGEPPLDTFGWTFFSGLIFTPAAIGDIDGDGVSELVVVAGNTVFGLRLYDPTPLFQRTLSEGISDAVTLGDIDLDGDVEIAVPTTTGKLYLLQGDGTDVPGWPFDPSPATAMTSAAWAQIRGTTAPELAVGARSWKVHLLYGTGAEASGFPTEPGSGWYVYGAPIMGRIEGGSGDVVVGSRGSQGWAWDNFGATIGGWPKELGFFNQINFSPAMGDIDNDGNNEVVFLGVKDLVIVDVGSPPLGPNSTWPMDGHDPQRTGCSDCAEDVATPVPDGPTGAVTRVQFRGAFPNPVAGPATQFRFAVPVRAVASLEIYDIRGALVQRVLKEEVAAGEHVVAWNGRDGHGRNVASGQYLARLRVQGPGVGEDMTRRVTVLR